MDSILTYHKNLEKSWSIVDCWILGPRLIGSYRDFFTLAQGQHGPHTGTQDNDLEL